MGSVFLECYPRTRPQSAIGILVSTPSPGDRSQREYFQYLQNFNLELEKGEKAQRYKGRVFYKPNLEYHLKRLKIGWKNKAEISELEKATLAISVCMGLKGKNGTVSALRCTAYLRTGHFFFHLVPWVSSLKILLEISQLHQQKMSSKPLTQPLHL